MSDPTMIIFSQRDDVLVAEVQGPRMDEDGTRVVTDQLLAEADKAANLPIVLDMSDVEFMPSLSLGALVSLLQQFKSRQRRFILAGMQPAVREGLTITRLDRLFEIKESVDDAIAAVKEPI